MAITYGFFDAMQQSDGTYDRTYNADQMSTYFEGLVSDGVYADIGNGMQVKAGTGMQVQVSPGRLLIDCKWLKNTAAYPITINPAHVTLDRYTAIVARLDYTARTITLLAKDGVPASSPVKPAVTRTQTIKELCLAYVLAKRGATSITQADIQDVRANTDICGLVTGLVEQLDTSEMFIQYEAAYQQQLAAMSNWQKQQTSLFESWFKTLTDKLNVDTYIKKYRKVHNTTVQATKIINLDMESYVYEASDILLINVNGIALVESVDYEINAENNPAEIIFKVDLDENNTVEITVLKTKIGEQE
nr:MAG TPA: Receptor Binding Protein [Caudoviricetes sp.]